MIVTTERELIVTSTLPEQPPWPEALCKTEDPDLWFGLDDGPGCWQANARRERVAVALCHTCPHIDACADYAVSNRIEYGVWGGLTEADRITIWAQEGEAA